MNENTKGYCSVCDCIVVLAGHEERCRPKSVKGWDVKRQLAWLGDAVHRMDVQLAVEMLEPKPACWEVMAQGYTSGAAQASYMRALADIYGGRSDHTVSTEFEANYFGNFRDIYLRAMFPSVVQRLLTMWTPPALDAFK